MIVSSLDPFRAEQQHLLTWNEHGREDIPVVSVHPGVVIVGEDTVGRYDLGIFVASVVPGGPADKDGRIRPGRETLTLCSL